MWPSAGIHCCLAEDRRSTCIAPSIVTPSYAEPSDGTFALSSWARPGSGLARRSIGYAEVLGISIISTHDKFRTVYTYGTGVCENCIPTCQSQIGRPILVPPHVRLEQAGTDYHYYFFEVRSPEDLPIHRFGKRLLTISWVWGKWSPRKNTTALD